MDIFIVIAETHGFPLPSIKVESSKVNNSNCFESEEVSLIFF